MSKQYFVTIDDDGLISYPPELSPILKQLFTNEQTRDNRLSSTPATNQDWPDDDTIKAADEWLGHTPKATNPIDIQKAIEQFCLYYQQYLDETMLTDGGTSFWSAKILDKPKADLYAAILKCVPKEAKGWTGEEWAKGHDECRETVLARLAALFDIGGEDEVS